MPQCADDIRVDRDIARPGQSKTAALAGPPHGPLTRLSTNLPLIWTHLRPNCVEQLRKSRSSLGNLRNLNVLLGFPIFLTIVECNDPMAIPVAGERCSREGGARCNNRFRSPGLSPRLNRTDCKWNRLSGA